MDIIKKINEITSLEATTYKIDNKDDTLKITDLGRALSAPIRLEIIRLINKKPMTLSEIASELNIQPSSAAFHLKILEDVSLIITEENKTYKSSKWYSYNKNPLIIIETRPVQKDIVEYPSFSTSIKIGDFIDAKVSNDCGMATENTQIMDGKPYDIFNPLRKDAMIIWSSASCFFKYAISNSYAYEDEIESISLSLELCSEARGYNPNVLSDITISINDIELCVYTSLGDYGNRYGRYTPSWWYVESTKYGTLITIYINKDGVYLNENLVNQDVNLDSLNLKSGNKTTIKLEVKEDSENVGGINLFGKKFGDYNQDINFLVKYVSKEVK